MGSSPNTSCENGASAMGMLVTVAQVTLALIGLLILSFVGLLVLLWLTK